MPALPLRRQTSRLLAALRLVRALVPLAIAAACLWLLAARMEELSLATLAADAADIPLLHWVGAALATGVSLWAVGRYDLVAHRHLGTGVAPRRALRAGVTAIALAQFLGFGLLTGAFVRWRLLGEIPARRAAQLTGFVALSFMIALGLLLALCALLAPPVPGARALAALALAGALTLAGLAFCCPRSLPGRLLPTLPAMAAILFWTLVDVLAAGLALWLLLPPDTGLSLSLFLPAFLAALALGLATGAPGGVGPFELTLLALLPETPAAALVTGIMGYRLVYFALPAMAAVAVLLMAPQRRHAPARDTGGPRVRQRPLPRDRPRAEAAVIAQSGGGLLRARRDALAVLELPQVTVGLFDPVTGNLRAALPLLRARAEAENRIAALYKCSARSAAVARRSGWRLRRIAVEAVIDAGTFDISGREHRQLRRKLRHAEQAEVTVMPCGDILPLTALAQVEAAWQADHGPAAGTTLGRFEPGYLAHQAVYTAWCGPRVVAFASFHRAEREWCLDLMRSCSDMPDGTMHSLIHAALTDARALGVARLSLAAVPDLPLLRGRAAGLRQFKESFAPRWEPRYLAAPSWPALALAAADIARAVHWPDPVVPVAPPAPPREEVAETGFTLPRAS